MDRKARLAGQGNVFQSSPRFNLVQGDRAAQRFDWRKIDRGPIAFFGGGIGIRVTNNFSNADDRFVGNAVIKENFVAHLHAAEIISRGKITDTSPTGLALGNEIVPGIRGRFRFHEPIVFHLRFFVILRKWRDPGALLKSLTSSEPDWRFRSDNDQGLGG